MERDKKYLEVKNIFGNKFIGFNEINNICSQDQFLFLENIVYENIPYPISFLKEKCNDYILFYFHPFINGKENFSINNLKNYLSKKNFLEVHFYNQDWYEKEIFANETNEKPGWYLLKETVFEESRGAMPNFSNKNIKYPSASICTYLFFLNYLVNKTKLWQYDYVWCSDLDSNGDNIYIGRYSDINKINKDGFSIHRHLKIKSNYGIIDSI